MKPTMLARQYGYPLARQRTGREGVSLVAALILVTSISALAASALMMSNASMRRQVAKREQVAARFAADAGLAEAVTRMRIGGSDALVALAQPMDFGGASFWVESSVGAGGVTSLVANGVMGDSNFRQQLVVRQAPRSIYSFGAFGEEELEMASNAHVDSYDSGVGTYESQEVNGSGQSAWASDRGTIGSNYDIIMRQNSRTFGDAMAGPTGDVTVMGSAYVTGSTARAPELQVLEPIEVPAAASSGPMTVPNRSSLSLGPGIHSFGRSSVGVGSKLEIQGPAQVIFDTLEVSKNSSVVVDASGGMVEIYVRNDFVLSSNTVLTTKDLDPAGLALYLESDNIIDPGQNVDLDEIDFESNSKMYGTIYAPNANIVINSNFELYGAVVARRLRLDSNSQVHYDESLVDSRGDTQTTLEVIGWRVLPRRTSDGIDRDEPDEIPTKTDPIDLPETIENVLLR